MNLVIVESPAKAKTINKYLGADYKVIASYGHIRDLPSKDGSVRPDEDFAMTYEISDKATKHVKEIADAIREADIVFLATDPDREGEAISWHIVEAMRARKALKKSTPVKRIVFNEITKKAVTDAVANPRDIDMDLVNAQQARRALDYLVGFTLSPVLWRKLPGSKSAGRVQSVALRLICDRESEIEAFLTREYWDIKLDLANQAASPFTATLTHLEGKKLDKFDLNNQELAQKTAEVLESKQYSVANIEKKQSSRSPQAPFTTSSLQQEASRKLGFGAKHTMQLAQRLYEGIELEGETVGLITYMRTDGVQVSVEAIESARTVIATRFGDNYVPATPRIYKAKAKNAQEAHEAIRPTHLEYFPEKVRPFLEQDQYRLYELIWKRMIASQMENVVLDQVAIVIETPDHYAALRATGSTIRFEGFYALYREGKDEEEDDEQKILPVVNIGEVLSLVAVKPAQHFTEPPPRYTEASLVKKMEELGIGRPSTYASIISVLQDRNYVKLDKKRFIPEERGRLVTAFLVSFFKRYVEYSFTADLEDRLDRVSNGEMQWKLLLKEFWSDFSVNTEEVKALDIPHILQQLDTLLERHIFPPSPDGKDNRLCPTCHKGRLSLKLGKFGAFIACSDYPECRYTRQITDAAEGAAGENGQHTEISEPRILGTDEVSGLAVSLRKGPYGFYIQLGEAEKGSKTKPKRAALSAPLTPDNVTLPIALGLLSLPREIGLHPETGEMISAGTGRFGPYILHQKKFISLPKEENVLTIALARAVSLLADAKPGKKAEPLRVIGVHPKEGEEVAIYEGRYGAYLKQGKINAPIPKGRELESITLEEAVTLIEEYAVKKGSKPAAAKKPAAKKAEAKKTEAKKVEPKKAVKAKKVAAQ